MEKAKSAKILYESGSKSVKEIAKILGISRATCYRYLESVIKKIKVISAKCATELALLLTLLPLW